MKFKKQRSINNFFQKTLILFISLNLFSCSLFDKMSSFRDSGIFDNNEVLEILNVDPLDTSENIPVDAIITIEFSKAIDETTLVVNDSFTLFNGTSGVNGVLTKILPGEWTFTPSAVLERNTTYTVMITTSVTDDSGSTNLNNDYSFSFTTKDYFKVLSHSFYKGTFDPNYSDFTTAFSDNTSGTDVDISSWIVIDFSSPVDVSTLNTDTRLSPDSGGGIDMPGTVTLRRTHIGSNTVDNTEDPGNIVILEVVQWLNGNQRCILKPLNQHFLISGEDTYSWYGVRPNCRYKLELTGFIEDSDGEAILQDGSQIFTYSTVNLDYGLYFSGQKQPDGYIYSEKYVPGRKNDFFVPGNKTIIWTHGFNADSTIKDYYREGMMYTTPEGDGGPWRGHDVSQYMIEDGWNFGTFYWNQFADETSEVKDAEAKIWNAISRGGGANNGRYGARYRVMTNSGSGEMVTTDSPDFRGPIVPLAIEFYKQYIAVMENNTAEKRIIGHSNGGQLIIPLAWLLARDIDSGVISSDYKVDQLYMQDSFWSKDAKGYFADSVNSVWGYSSSQWTGAVVRDFIDDIKAWDPSMAILQDKYQNYMNGDARFLGAPLYIGDNNFDLRRKTCVIYVYPAWMPDNAINTAKRHSYGKYYYFWTYKQDIHNAITASGGVTARTSKSVLNSYMNNGFDDKVFKQVKGSHRNTPYPGDNDYDFVPLGFYW